MSSKNYMVQLDGLRAVAVAFVMFGHWTYAINRLQGIDHFLATVGVNLFFVLSGFLITLILIQAKENNQASNGFILKQFYIRRFLRIFPLYYFVIFVGVVLKIPVIRAYFFWFINYCANWVIGFNKGNCFYYTHLWSLCVEEQFYIFFPLLFLLNPRKYIKSFFISLILFAVAYRLLMYYSHTNGEAYWPAYSFTPSCLDAFGIGALLAFFKFYYHRQTEIFFQSKIKLVAVVIIIVAGYLDIHNMSGFLSIASGRLIISIFSVVLIGIASYSNFKGIAGKFLGNRFIVYAGKISYGLYVYHHIIPFFFKNIAPFNSFYANFFFTRFLYLITTFLIAGLSWQFFESPINNMKKYFSYTKPQPSVS